MYSHHPILHRLKLWFLELVAHFLDSAGDDGVRVHIGTSSGYRGGGSDPSISINVKGNGDDYDGRGRWWGHGDRDGGIRLNIGTGDKRRRPWWIKK